MYWKCYRSKITEITLCENENKHKCNSYTLYIMLFSIVFTFNVGIGTYFVYFYWYLKNDDPRVMLYICTETAIYWTYKWSKSNKWRLKIKVIIFFDDIVDITNFYSNLLIKNKKS